MFKVIKLKRNCVFKKCCSFLGTVSDSYVVTTPIFYVNGAPHLGHLYSAVIADASHRFHKMLGIDKTIFSTGTDEHGLKIQQAAEKASMDVKMFCDSMSSKFQSLFEKASISHTRFVRTTEEQHKEAVCHFWNLLAQNGNIYVGNYEGWYCTSDETFLTESQLTNVCGKDGQQFKISSESGHPVEWVSESNYMFKLSKYKDDLLHWLRGKDVIYPKKFSEILIKYCEEDLADLSVSRARSRLKWGIPVPNDPSQTVYVWLDALVNYLTVCGYPSEKFMWPPNVQVIGKDILKFHGIYWPALLMAARLDPPRKLFCHSHWTVDNEKMSKSKGNVVDPLELIAKTCGDGVRYFLLAEGVPHSDGNYSANKFTALLNAELADTLGNLLNRCTSKTLNPQQIFPIYDSSCLSKSNAELADTLLSTLTRLPDDVRVNYEEMNFYKGIEQVMSCLRQANRFMQECKPWELKDQVNVLNSIIFVPLETLRVCALLLSPIIPNLSTRLLDRLAIPNTERNWNNCNISRKTAKNCVKLGTNIAPLFNRLKTET